MLLPFLPSFHRSFLPPFSLPFSFFNVRHSMDPYNVETKKNFFLISQKISSAPFFPSCFHLKFLATVSNSFLLTSSNNMSSSPLMTKTVVCQESSGLFPAFSFFIFSSKTQTGEADQWIGTAITFSHKGRHRICFMQISTN